MISDTQKLSELLASMKYENFDDIEITQAKKLTVHIIGVAIAALGTIQANAVKELVRGCGGTDRASVWGTDLQINLEDAVFANGTLSDILNWEDCSWFGHPSSGVISAAFSIAEAKHKSGKDYITAIIAAYEGYQRLAMYCKPGEEYREKHGSAMMSWQIFASLFATAKLFRFSAQEINQSIGAAVYHSVLPITKHTAAGEKSDIFHFAIGSAARNGVFAAKLVKAGFNNGLNYLDGQTGFWSFVSDTHNTGCFEKKEMESWSVMNTYLKQWPANLWIQAPLEALSKIYSQDTFGFDEVEYIYVSPDTYQMFSNYSETTKTILDAIDNTTYCLASFLMENVPGAKWFCNKQLNNPQLLSFTKKIRAYGEKMSTGQSFALYRAGEFPETKIIVKLKDGRELTENLVFPKGHPHNPTSLRDECLFFKKVTAGILPGDKADAFLTYIGQLETLDDMSIVADCLRIEERSNEYV